MMRVVDPSGVPFAQANVRMWKKNDVFMLKYPRAQASEKGWFSIDSLKLGQRYGVEIAGVGRAEFIAKIGGDVVLPRP